jgi:hypothetical protein
MSPHESIRELLALAAAGVLDAAGERAVRQHVRDCAACAAELESLRSIGESLGHLPCTAPSPELLARTRAVAEAELAARIETRWADILMAITVLLGWTVTFSVWVAWRVVTGGAPALMNTDWTEAARWLGVSTLLAWMTAGAAALMLGRRGRPNRSAS